MADETSNGYIRISNREIYDQVVRLHQRIEGLESRIDAVLGESIDNQRRLRAVELKVYTVLAGLTTALSAGGLYLLKG